MKTTIILAIITGASIGGILGQLLKNSGGSCPLTCNPWGGMIVGAIIGLYLVFGFGRQTEISFSSNVIEIESYAQMENILKESDVSLIDYYLDSCGPCQQLKPIIQQLADELKGKVKILALNLDKNKDIASKLGIIMIPDVRIYKKGIEIERVVGLKDRQYYLEIIKKAQSNQL